MRPWRTWFGHGFRSTGLNFNAATAMRPWRTSRKMHWRRPRRTLQCGHGDEAVENRPQPNSPSLSGIDFNAATAMRPWRTRRCGRSGCRRRNFNAATAMRPWRTLAEIDAEAEKKKLQCGHGDEAVENVCMAWSVPDAFILQCGHGDEAVENSVAGRFHRSSHAYFNAATAMRPWRTGPRAPIVQ